MVDRESPAFANMRAERPKDTPQRDIRVMLAEDSMTIRRHLATMINETPGMRVVGEARDGREALLMVPELKPDVISMDVRMPGVDGLEATRRIMETYPTPVVIVSGLIETEVDLSIQALEAGALAVVEKPPSRTDPVFDAKYRHLVKTLAAMSRVSVVRRGNTKRLPGDDTVEIKQVNLPNKSPEIIAIGASAGGPSALGKLVGDFPTTMPVPVVIVQHMPNEFIGGLARWLEKLNKLPVKVIENNMVLLPGVVHLAPGKAHVRILRQRNTLVARLIFEQGKYKYFPAVDVLFESVAETCGSAAIGLILTGMGDDGSAGLLRMREAGARTFAQNRASSTVFGMPGAAIERGAVEQVLPLASLSTVISNLV